MWSDPVLCFLFFIAGLVASFSHQDIGHHATHRIHSHKAGRRHRAANDTTLRFEPEPYNKKLELKSAGKIHCKVAGGVAPIVQWFLNSEDPLPEGLTSTNGTLIISEAEKRYAGNYTCRASEAGATISAAIRLDVVVSPRVLRPTPEQVVQVLAGESAVLPCDVTGDPAPTTHWDRNLTVLNANVSGVTTDVTNTSAPVVLLSNGSLLLRDVNESSSATYGCTAGSPAGLARGQLTLVVLPEGSILPSDSPGVGSKAVIISTAVAAAYMLLVLALMFYCRRRRLNRRQRGEKIELEMAEGREKLVEDGEEDKKKVSNGTHANGRLAHDKDSGADNSEVSAISRASKKSGQYDHLAVPRSLVTDAIVLGRGEFGDVSLAKIDINQVKKHRGRGENITGVKMKPVLVKILTAKDETTLSEFRRQLELFSRVKHENIVKLIALCNEQEPHWMVLEHTDWGDLKTFLSATRGAGVGVKPAPPLLRRHNAMLSAQLASALLPMAAARLTHRDIACRNCMITSSLQLKLSYPALLKGPLANEYYKMHDRVIPLRWLPLEAVAESDYSTKSDVYMYAATVWEIYTKAELPFSKLSDSAVLEKLKNAELEWSAPENMPERLVTLLNRCWSVSPSDRPQFTEICDEMKLLQQEIAVDAELEGEIQ